MTSPTLSALKTARKWMQGALDNEPDDFVSISLKRALAKVNRAIAAHKAFKPRLIVVTQGGVIQGACANIDVSFEVYDKDDEQETDPEASPDEAARFKRLSEECDNLPAVY